MAWEHPDRIKIGWVEWGAVTGRLNRVKQAIEDGHDINFISESGLAALHCASYQGHYEICKYLLDHGADPNLLCNEGRTALDYAKEFNYPNIVTLLQNWPGAIRVDEHGSDGPVP